MNTEVSEIVVNGKPFKGLKIIGDSIQSQNNTHTIILLDVSGSMECDHKLDNVKKSLNFMLKFLQKSDYLSLVTFSDIPSTVIDNVKVTSEYQEIIKYSIDTLRAEGGTNLSAGLLDVKGILERANPQDVTKTGLIILTDGHVNEGVVRSEELMRIIYLIKSIEPNISITTIGYGEDHNASLLSTIATNGSGSYNVVNNFEQVATVFGDILGGLMSTVVQNVKVSYPKSWNCINAYTKTVENNTNVMFIGDVCAESETIILFEDTDVNNVQIQGIKVSDYSNISKTVSWEQSQLSTNLMPYHMAYIRNAIAYILKNIKIMDPEGIKNSLKPIKEYLDLPLIQFHPLTKILKEQIENIEEQIQTPSILNDTMNLQTSAMLALGRGVSVGRTPTRVSRVPRRRLDSVDEDDIANILNNVTMATPFSNTVQRDIAARISTMAEEDPEDLN